MIHLSQEILFTAAALLCAGVASVHDVRERRIPNLLTGPALVLALGGHLVFGGWGGLLGSAAAGLLAGALLLLFFMAGGMGAGDVKLMAAVGCLVGLPPLGLVLFATAVCGALFGLFLALRHGRLRQTVANALMLVMHHRREGLVPHDEVNLDGGDGLRMPFALPIAAGCLVACGSQMWGS